MNVSWDLRSRPSERALARSVWTVVEAVVNSRPLVNVGADLNSGFALNPGDFLSLSQKNGLSCLAPEDKQLQNPDVSKRLVPQRNFWKHGRKARNISTCFGKCGLINMRWLFEKTQKHFEAPRVQSKVNHKRRCRASERKLLRKNLEVRDDWKTYHKQRQWSTSTYSPNSPLLLAELTN